MCNIWPEALAIQKGLDSICIGIDNKKLCEIAGEASKYRIEIQQQLAAAKAELAAEREKREQTEAQCAAMRQILDKIYDGAKLAYSHGCSCVEISFEGLKGIGLIDIGAGTVHKQYPTAGTTILTRLHRMEGALKMARPALVRADSDTSYIAHRYMYLLKNANCPLTEDELLKTSGMCRNAEKAVKAALEDKP